MGKFHLYFEERLGKSKANLLKFKSLKGGKYCFAIGKEKFIIENEKELVEFVFGMPGEKGRKTFCGEGELTKILNVVFPLPFIQQGFNYI